MFEIFIEARKVSTRELNMNPEALKEELSSFLVRGKHGFFFHQVTKFVACHSDLINSFTFWSTCLPKHRGKLEHRLKDGVLNFLELVAKDDSTSLYEITIVLQDIF